MKISDSDLVRQTMEGNIEAFGTLVKKYQNAVYGFAFHQIKNFSDAQDIAQEAFLAAYRSLDKLRDPSRFAGWLKGITANLCMVHRRREKDIVSVETLPRKEQETALENAMGRIPSPDQQYEKKVLSETVRKAMETLPEDHRLCMSLYFIDGLTYKEISSFVNAPLNTVKSWIHRAKQQLRKVLWMVEKEYGGHKLTSQFARNVIEEAMQEGHKLFKNREWGKAILAFQQVTEIDPQRADAHHWLGRAYSVYAYRGAEGMTKREKISEESIDSSIAEYKKAIEIDPGYGPAHAHLANLYDLHKGMIEEATVEYKKAAEVGGMDTEEEHFVYNNLGYIYRDKGMYEEALEWFNKAMAVDPSVSYVPWGMAVVYAMQGKALEAVEFLKRSIDLGEKPDRIKRIDIPNGWFDNIKETKEFQGFLQSIE